MSTESLPQIMSESDPQLFRAFRVVQEPVIERRSNAEFFGSVGTYAMDRFAQAREVKLLVTLRGSIKVQFATHSDWPENITPQGRLVGFRCRSSAHIDAPWMDYIVSQEAWDAAEKMCREVLAAEKAGVA